MNTRRDDIPEYTHSLLLKKGVKISELRAALSSLMDIYLYQGMELDMQKAANSELIQINDELRSLNTEIHIKNIALSGKLNQLSRRLQELTISYRDIHN